MDLAFGADEQNFEIAFPAPTLSGGELLYIDGTEYGGIVDEITRSTETDDVIYIGRTWHGMLAGKIVKPPSNADYYVLSGDANTCIASLLTKVGLTDVLTARSTSAGISVNYQFDRFCNAYDGLLKMLASANAVLRIERHDGITELWAEPRVTITDEADSDLMDFALTDSIRVPNHLVCAGEGELQERVVVDLYADSSGNVSQTQSLTGVDEIAVLYNYNNADAAELIAEGTKELQSYQLGGGADLQVKNKGDWHVGDSIQVRDNNSGLVITSTIAKKIVKVKDGVLSVDYEVGNASAKSYGGGASAETALVTPIANGGTGATTAAGARANLGLGTTAPGTVLWSDSYVMNASQTAYLSANVSSCPTGIVLHWQAYENGATQNYDHVYQFIPKNHVVVASGKGITCLMTNAAGSKIGRKYVYVHDDNIVGNSNNTATGTASGITFANNYWVLTQIIAV